MKYNIKVSEKWLIGESATETIKGTVRGDTTAVYSRMVGEMSAYEFTDCRKEAASFDRITLCDYLRGIVERQNYGHYLGEIKVIPEDREEVKAQLPKREEVWKDVIGYEGLYQVSNQARVRNSKGQILKQCVKVGKCVYYKYVQLYKDGRYKMKYVHRIMAECFLPNPNNLPIINHKDEDGTNNRLDNLEWCTVEYNSNYGNAKRNMSRGKRRRAKMNDSNALNALDNAQDGPIITPCRGCSDYDGYGGCKSKGGCARAKMEVQDADK